MQVLLINFWLVLLFLVAFWSLKQVKNEGELGIVHGKGRLKPNYMRNPSFGELRSLCQINQVCKDENQRRNLTFVNFATPCEIFASQKEILQPLFQPCEIFATLRNLPEIFRYFCTDSIRFLSQDILCNYLFSPYNQIKIF